MVAKTKYHWAVLALIIAHASLSACAIFPYYSHYNVRTYPQKDIPRTMNAPSGSYLASEDVQWRLNSRCRNTWQFKKDTEVSNPIAVCPHDDTNFIAIAISGGGSRAAIFSAAVMFELERYGLLQQVDAISSVSGGSFTAAYYVLSCDAVGNCPPTVEGTTRPRWDPQEVFPRLEKNFIVKWIINSLWIENILRYWFSYFDRTDIMVGVLADTLYDTSWFEGAGFKFRDLNPQRPHLIINATNNTEDSRGTKIFSFTKGCFDELRSSIDHYSLAHAVMASAAFPAVFQSVTLRDFSHDEEWYLHLLDGGASDNLGITSLTEILEKNTDKDSKKLVIVIDAHTPSRGKDPRDPNPRSFIDYFVDTNVIDAYQSLMAELRYGKTDKLQQWLEENNGKLIHIQFPDLQADHPELYDTVARIRTNLKIKKNDATCLKHAARIIVQKKMEELQGDPRWSSLIQFPPKDGCELPPYKPKKRKAQDEAEEEPEKSKENQETAPVQ